MEIINDLGKEELELLEDIDISNKTIKPEEGETEEKIFVIIFILFIVFIIITYIGRITQTF